MDREEAYKLLQTLSDRQKEVLRRRCANESHPEIARAMGWKNKSASKGTWHEVFIKLKIANLDPQVQARIIKEDFCRFFGPGVLVDYAGPTRREWPPAPEPPPLPPEGRALVEAVDRHLDILNRGVKPREKPGGLTIWAPPVIVVPDPITRRRRVGVALWLWLLTLAACLVGPWLVWRFGRRVVTELVPVIQTQIVSVPQTQIVDRVVTATPENDPVPTATPQPAETPVPLSPVALPFEDTFDTWIRPEWVMVGAPDAPVIIAGRLYTERGLTLIYGNASMRDYQVHFDYRQNANVGGSMFRLYLGPNILLDTDCSWKKRPNEDADWDRVTGFTCFPITPRWDPATDPAHHIHLIVSGRNYKAYVDGNPEPWFDVNFEAPLERGPFMVELTSWPFADMRFDEFGLYIDNLRIEALP